MEVTPSSSKDDFIFDHLSDSSKTSFVNATSTSSGKTLVQPGFERPPLPKTPPPSLPAEERNRSHQQQQQQVQQQQVQQQQVQQQQQKQQQQQPLKQECSSALSSLHASVDELVRLGLQVPAGDSLRHELEAEVGQMLTRLSAAFPSAAAGSSPEAFAGKFHHQGDYVKNYHH
jgi:flagellar motor protein MotB